MYYTLIYSRFQMKTQISISLSESQITELDRLARKDVLSRSAFARQTLVKNLDLIEEGKKNKK